SACSVVQVTRLDPGEPLPDWVRALDGAAFGEAWGELAAQERVWTLEDAAFARWSVLRLAGEAELLRVAVYPAARRRGLGRRLLEACEAELRALGIAELHLEVRVTNTAARALYEACGWRAAGLRPGYYRDGEDAAIYSKSLAPRG
ncbi:MAG TPA: GNAT family N-acetyltransferase, partial [Holophagaceae bacterium]|nr:GNAT family N-acetyltransferase [Holophagaceae bacterium]